MGYFVNDNPSKVQYSSLDPQTDSLSFFLFFFAVTHEAGVRWGGYKSKAPTLAKLLRVPISRPEHPQDRQEGRFPEIYSHHRRKQNPRPPHTPSSPPTTWLPSVKGQNADVVKRFSRDAGCKLWLCKRYQVRKPDLHC